jgi:hypothetical protein
MTEHSPHKKEEVGVVREVEATHYTQITSSLHVREEGKEEEEEKEEEKLHI